MIRNDSSLFKFLLLIQPYWGGLLGVAAAGMLPALLSLPLPFLLQVFIDRVLIGRDSSLLGFLLLATFSLTLCLELMRFLQRYTVDHLSQRISLDIQFRFFQRLQAHSFAFFDQHEVADILARLGDASWSRALIMQACGDLLTSLLFLLLVPFILLVVDWRLALLAGVAVPWTLISTTLISRVIRRFTRLISEKRAEVASRDFEYLAGTREIKALTWEEGILRRIRRLYLQNRSLEMKRSAWVHGERAFSATMKALAALFYSAYGAHLVMKGEMTVGQFTAFTALIGYLYLPLVKLSEMIIPFQQLRVHTRRFYEVFAAEPDLPEESKEQRASGVRIQAIPGGREGQIVFDQVAFSYDKGAPILQGLDLIIEPGSKVAIQGRSGAGKTTLCHLIPRFYDVQGGSIRVDGRDVRDYPLKEVRRRVALVSQIPFLFNASIWENLTCGRRSLSREKVEEITRAVQAHPFILSLPQGYETVIGERGVRLSLGQGRRIALARALLLERPILILDETFAFLDEETEERIQEALLPLVAEKTVIVVAHRTSTARRAETVFFLEHGRMWPERKVSAARG